MLVGSTDAIRNVAIATIQTQFDACSFSSPCSPLPVRVIPFGIT